MIEIRIVVDCRPIDSNYVLVRNDWDTITSTYGILDVQSQADYNSFMLNILGLCLFDEDWYWDTIKEDEIDTGIRYKEFIYKGQLVKFQVNLSNQYIEECKANYTHDILKSSVPICEMWKVNSITFNNEVLTTEHKYNFEYYDDVLDYIEDNWDNLILHCETNK